jgi:hypothetical protein
MNISIHPGHKEISRYCWVRSAGLPLYLYHQKVLRAIGDALGSYQLATLKTLRMEDIPRMMVLMDQNGGPPNRIVLDYGENQWEQKNDYEQIPFRCRYSHGVGHTLHDCHRMVVVYKIRRSSENSMGVNPALNEKCGGSLSKQNPRKGLSHLPLRSRSHTAKGVSMGDLRS